MPWMRSLSGRAARRHAHADAGPVSPTPSPSRTWPSSTQKTGRERPNGPWSGQDRKGSDGWGVNWNTRLVTDGSYLMRITTLDTPPGQPRPRLRPSSTRRSSRSGCPTSRRLRTTSKLRASAPVRGARRDSPVHADLAHGQIARSVANLKLTAVIDPGLFRRHSSASTTAPPTIMACRHGPARLWARGSRGPCALLPTARQPASRPEDSH